MIIKLFYHRVTHLFREVSNKVSMKAINRLVIIWLMSSLLPVMTVRAAKEIPVAPASWNAEQTAQWEALTKEARTAADTYGINSPEAVRARKKLSDLSDALGHQRPHYPNQSDSRNSGNPGSPAAPDGAKPKPGPLHD
jgi:hypothetical protein